MRVHRRGVIPPPADRKVPLLDALPVKLHGRHPTCHRRSARCPVRAQIVRSTSAFLIEALTATDTIYTIARRSGSPTQGSDDLLGRGLACLDLAQIAPQLA